MASKESQAIKDMYRAWTEARLNPDPIDPLGHIDHWGDVTAEPRAVDYLEVDANGVPAMWVVPKGCAADRVILCLHGGGFVGGSRYTHRKLFGHLAKAVGARALIADYRLSYQHPHPAQVDDATAAFQWLLDQGFRAERMAFAGDSSGGGLCLTTVLRARERRLPQPAALMLISPWSDMELSGASYETNHEKDAFFYREVVQGLVDAFLGKEGSAKDPLANPLYADLSGFPPIYIQVGSDETLLDDTRLLEGRARKYGVEVRRDVFPDQQHTFQMAAGRAPEADEAIRRFAAWVAPKLGLTVRESAAAAAIDSRDRAAAL
ncbi:alpha/beta hydrolase [Pendulispora albinea]|uniref:Alpha/beta hydrolase n=1 Tax=Pendulispora albinea TaxID=2741071 RepID=A0ABZ2M3B2_9BACT